MIFSGEIEINTKQFQEINHVPFYTDFNTFFEECYRYQVEIDDLLDKAVTETLKYFYIPDDFNAKESVLSDAYDEVLEQIKFKAQIVYRKLKNEVEDIDFDINETPYLFVEVPTLDNIKDEMIDYCYENYVYENFMDEVIEELSTMIDSSLTDLEYEFVIGGLYDQLGEDDESLIDIAESKNENALDKIVNKLLEEYHKERN